MLDLVGNPEDRFSHNEAHLSFQMREAIKEYPVLLMPSHRSYLDFLLMSYVNFHYDLPLPVIAAAMGKD